MGGGRSGNRKRERDFSDSEDISPLAKAPRGEDQARGRVHSGEGQPEEEAGRVRDVLCSIYRITDAHTSLFFGADRDIDAVARGSKRARHLSARRQVKSQYELDALRRSRTDAVEEDTSTWSLGYGELTVAGFAKVLSYMLGGAPAPLRMTSKSSFLDIGAGYGKAVFHASAAVPFLQRCTGIECMPFRHARSAEVCKQLKEAQLLRAPVQLLRADATTKERFAHSHIFAFDYVFSDATQRALLPIVVRSRPKIFVSFSHPSRIRRLGGERLALLAKISGCRTTGGQNLTGYAFTHASHAKYASDSHLLAESASPASPSP